MTTGKRESERMQDGPHIYEGFEMIHTDKTPTDKQSDIVAELRGELKTISQQLALLWIDLQGRAPADKLRVLDAIAHHASDVGNAAALSHSATKETGAQVIISSGPVTGHFNKDLYGGGYYPDDKMGDSK